MTDPDVPTAADMHACLGERALESDTPFGPMEYAVRGEGRPLLTVYGTPGGYQEGLLAAEYFRANGFRVIAPSRPGYGGTALGVGRSSEEQADAMAALLDALDIAQAAVLGFSGGGASSYLLAARHPDRVASLLEADSISMAIPSSRLDRLAFSQRPLVALQSWLLDHVSGRMLRWAGAPAAEAPDAAAAHLELMRDIIVSVSDWPTVRAGYDNDDAQFAALGDLPLGRIRCPTLIIHGTADSSVPPSHAEHAHAAIAGSELLWMPDAPHFAFIVRPDVERSALEWLREHR